MWYPTLTLSCPCLRAWLHICQQRTHSLLQGAAVGVSSWVGLGWQMPNLLPAIRCLCGNKVGKLHNEPEDDSEEGCREAERINPFSAALGGQPRCSPPQCSLGLGLGPGPYCSHLQVSVRAAASQAVKLPSAFNAAWGHPRSSG